MAVQPSVLHTLASLWGGVGANPPEEDAEENTQVEADRAPSLSPKDASTYNTAVSSSQRSTSREASDVGGFRRLTTAPISRATSLSSTTLPVANSKPQTLQFVMQEMKANARSAEKLLWELSHQLQQKIFESKHLKERIEQNRKKASLEVTRDALSDKLDASDEQAQENQNIQKELALRIESIKKDVSALQQEKMEKLKFLEKHVTGGATATFADSLFMMGSASNKSPFAIALANTFRALPPPNVAVLEQAKYFTFAKETLRHALTIRRRVGFVDCEGALFTGIYRSGTQISFVELVTEMDPEDAKIL